MWDKCRTVSQDWIKQAQIRKATRGIKGSMPNIINQPIKCTENVMILLSYLLARYNKTTNKTAVYDHMTFR